MLATWRCWWRWWYLH